MTEWWDRLPLDALDQAQWEALCDGCGRCCLHKLLDVDSGELYFTRVHCRYLNVTSRRCTVYDTRQAWVADCVVLERGGSQDFDNLPATCAYRLRAQGKLLPAWHPLRTDDKLTGVFHADIVLDGRVISEDHVHPDGLEEHIVHWVDDAEHTS